MTLERFSFLFGSGIAIFGALIHWFAPVLGADWYAFLTAPNWVIASARNHTWAAPVGGVVIGVLMFMCAVYALSGTGLIRRIPLLRTGLCAISTICLVRGLLLLPLLIRIPEKLTSFDIVASVVWFLAGLAFLIGTIGRWQAMSANVR